MSTMGTRTMSHLVVALGDALFLSLERSGGPVDALEERKKRVWSDILMPLLVEHTQRAQHQEEQEECNDHTFECRHRCGVSKLEKNQIKTTSGPRERRGGLLDCLLACACAAVCDHRTAVERLVGSHATIAANVFEAYPFCSHVACASSSSFSTCTFCEKKKVMTPSNAIMTRDEENVFGNDVLEQQVGEEVYLPLSSNLSGASSPATVVIESTPLPWPSWSLQEGTKALRKVLQQHRASLVAAAVAEVVGEADKSADESTIVERTVLVSVLDGWLAALEYAFLPKYVQGYARSSPPRLPQEQRTLPVPAMLMQGVANIGALQRQFPLALVEGCPNVAIVECSLAPAAAGTETFTNVVDSSAHDGPPGVVVAAGPAVAAADLVEGALIPNPALLLLPMPATDTHSTDTKVGKDRAGSAASDEVVVLAPFSELLRIPQHELFHSGTARQYSRFMQLLHSDDRVMITTPEDTRSNRNCLKCFSNILASSFEDDETRLILSFVFEAKRSAAMTAAVEDLAWLLCEPHLSGPGKVEEEGEDEAASTRHNANAFFLRIVQRLEDREAAGDKLSSSSSISPTPTTASPSSLLLSTRRTSMMIAPAKSHWDRLLKRCPVAFPTVPSAWPMHQVLQLAGTALLEETIQKHENVRTFVEDGVRRALFFALREAIQMTNASTSLFSTSSSLGTQHGSPLSTREDVRRLQRLVEDTWLNEGSFWTLPSLQNSTSTASEEASEEDDDGAAEEGTDEAEGDAQKSVTSNEDEDGGPADPMVAEDAMRQLAACGGAAQAILAALFPELLVAIQEISKEAISAETDGMSARASAEVLLAVHALRVVLATLFTEGHVHWARAVFDSRAFNLNFAAVRTAEETTTSSSHPMSDNRIEGVETSDVRLVLAPTADMINHSARRADVLVRKIDPATGDMLMLLGAPITHAQLLRGTFPSSASTACSASFLSGSDNDVVPTTSPPPSLLPPTELIMSYGPLQNWELLNSYGFALGNVVGKVQHHDEEEERCEGRSGCVRTLGVADFNPYDRLPLPLDVTQYGGLHNNGGGASCCDEEEEEEEHEGLDEDDPVDGQGEASVEARYAERRRLAIIHHGLDLCRGSSAGEGHKNAAQNAGNTKHDNNFLWVAPRGVPLRSSTNTSINTPGARCVIFPAVLALLRLHHATIEEFDAVEANPFVPIVAASDVASAQADPSSPPPFCVFSTERKVWHTLFSMLAAAGSFDGFYQHEEDDEEDGDEGSNEDHHEEKEEEDLTALRRLLDRHILEARTDAERALAIDAALQRIKSEKKNDSRKDNSSAKEKDDDNEGEDGGEEEEDENDLICEKLSLLVRLPLKIAAVEGMRACLHQLQSL